MKKCAGNGYDIDHCRVEKMSCDGCNYYREEEEHEQKISECAKD